MTTQNEKKATGTVGQLLSIMPRGNHAVKEPTKLLNFKLKESEYQMFKEYCDSVGATMTDVLKEYIFGIIK